MLPWYPINHYMNSESFTHLIDVHRVYNVYTLTKTMVKMDISIVKKQYI